MRYDISSQTFLELTRNTLIPGIFIQTVTLILCVTKLSVGIILIQVSLALRITFLLCVVPVHIVRFGKLPLSDVCSQVHGSLGIVPSFLCFFRPVNIQ